VTDPDTPSAATPPAARPREQADPDAVQPSSTQRPKIDPEDWASSPTDDDERYQRERPPHWE
jgi:hypothetical protein